MQRRDFLRGLCGAAASLLGLGAVKAVASSVKEPLRIVETFGNYETWRIDDVGRTERLSGGTVRLNRMLEPGECIPLNFAFPDGFQVVEQRWSMPLFEPEASWHFKCVETIRKIHEQSRWFTGVGYASGRVNRESI